MSPWDIFLSISCFFEVFLSYVKVGVSNAIHFLKNDSHGFLQQR